MPDQVKRLRFDAVGKKTFVHPDGELVRHSDYQKLEELPLRMRFLGGCAGSLSLPRGMH